MEYKKNMKKTGGRSTLAALCLASLMLTAPAAQAARVAVIPLGSKIYIGATIFWTGAWRDNFQYVIGDGMQHEGSSYILFREQAAERDLLEPDGGEGRGKG